MSLPLNPFTSSTIPSMKKSPSSPSLEERDNQMQIGNVDRISCVPDGVLLNILNLLPTEQAVQTSLLSKRWEGVWKQMPHLFFDMRNSFGEEQMGMIALALRSSLIAQMITKVINNHSGNLEHCEIQHLPQQTVDGTLENWIRSLIHVKHTKSLVLESVPVTRRQRLLVLYLPPNIFSHPTLTSLLLSRYKFKLADAFNNCNNLTTLKLFKTKCEVGVLNQVVASCPSLMMLVLQIFWYTRDGCLKIHNNNLKFLHLAGSEIDKVDVSASLLEIFSVNDVELASGMNIILDAPRLQFSKRCWNVIQSLPHIVYNISCDAEGNENIGHEFVMDIENYFMIVFGTLEVSVDMKNPKEVYMLKEVLDAWASDLRMLEIYFKHNDVNKEEGESSIEEIQESWEDFFLDVDFRVRSVWLYNFSGMDEDEFALAASFVMNGRMMDKLMIKTSSLPANKVLEIDTAVAKLMKLPKGNEELTIEIF